MLIEVLFNRMHSDRHMVFRERIDAYERLLDWAQAEWPIAFAAARDDWEGDI